MGFAAGSGRTTPIEPPKPITPPPPPMSGGKGAGRVSPIVESRPMFRPAPPPVRAGGKGAARVQPTQASLDNSVQQFKNETSPQENLSEYQSAIRGFPQQSKDLLPEPKLGQQLSSPAATQVEEKKEFAPEIRPYITDILDKAQAQEEARQKSGTPIALGGSEGNTELGGKLINMTTDTLQQAGQQSGRITAPPPTPIRGGGKSGPTADRVAPVTPQPMPMTPPPAPMTPPPIPPGLDNPVFRSLGQQQAAQQPQQSITGMNTNTGSTNSMPAPQSAIFKQGGLIGLMRRR